MSTSVTTSKTVIRLLGHPVYNEDGAATEAITPGMLVKGVSEIAKQTVNDAIVPVTVALEREEMGKSIDDDYAIGDTVKIGAFGKGQRFLGILASGEDIAEGELLQSAGGGLLTTAASAAVAIGRSLEEIETTAITRVRVEVI